MEAGRETTGIGVREDVAQRVIQEAFAAQAVRVGDTDELAVRGVVAVGGRAGGVRASDESAVGRVVTEGDPVARPVRRPGQLKLPVIAELVCVPAPVNRQD